MRTARWEPGISPPTAPTGLAKAGIPSIGFGPGDEKTAHTIKENVPLDDMVNATEFYAYLPKALTENL